MLAKIHPKEVAEKWPILSPLISKSLPKIEIDGEEYLQRVLDSIMVGAANVWLYKSGDAVKGVLMTTTFVDPVLMCQKLLIYTATAVDPLVLADYKIVMENLREYAREHDFISVIAFVKDPKLIDALSRSAPTERYQLLEIPVI